MSLQAYPKKVFSIRPLNKELVSILLPRFLLSSPVRWTDDKSTQLLSGSTRKYKPSQIVLGSIVLLGYLWSNSLTVTASNKSDEEVHVETQLVWWL